MVASSILAFPPLSLDDKRERALALRFESALWREIRPFVTAASTAPDDPVGVQGASSAARSPVGVPSGNASDWLTRCPPNLCRRDVQTGEGRYRAGQPQSLPVPPIRHRPVVAGTHLPRPG